MTLLERRKRSSRRRTAAVGSAALTARHLKDLLRSRDWSEKIVICSDQ